MNLDKQIVPFRSLSDLEKYLELLGQISNRFIELTDKIHTGSEKIYNSIQLEHREGNHRFLVLNHILQHIEHSRYSLNQHIYILKSLNISGNTIENIISELSSILRTPQSDIHNLDETILKRLLYNPLCDFYYSIENYFWTLNNALGAIEKKRPSYNELYNFIFDKFCLDKSSNSYNTYKVIGHFRNAIHNNYVHMHKDELAITVYQWEFSFVENKHIEWEDLNPIFTLLETCIDSLIEISLHDEVKKIPNDKIKERFWKSVSTTNT